MIYDVWHIYVDFMERSNMWDVWILEVVIAIIHYIYIWDPRVYLFDISLYFVLTKISVEVDLINSWVNTWEASETFTMW